MSRTYKYALNLSIAITLILSLVALSIPVLAQEGGYNEAPILAEQVQAGELSPVDERLPANPMVVTPYERVGEYGGVWHMGLRGGNDDFFLYRTLGYEPLMRWTPEWDGYIPNVAESVEANEEATEFVFKLREGMKWSDGAPLTADDIMFWYEDVALNTELSPAPPNRFVVDGEFATVEKIDDYTVKFSFAGPYGFFLLRMAMEDGLMPINHPKHYMQQFHKDYNEEVGALAEEAGFASWVDFYAYKASDWENPEKPTLHPWKLSAPYPGGDSIIVADRNPYYWKVDPEGNQLPYIDQVMFFVGEEVDALVLQALNGEIDMQSRHIGILQNKPIFFDGQEAGDYHLFTTKSSWGNAFCIFPNLTVQDPVLRELFRNKDFRIGLSHAINRQEIIDLVYLSQGTPSQFAPHMDGPFANEQMSTQFVEYDIELANEYLDKAGLTERDEEGFRLRPDGERLFITAEVSPAPLAELADGMELVKKYWADVGVDLNVKVEDRSIQWERKAANELEIFVWAAGGGGGLDVLLNVQSYFPDRTAAFQAPAWGDWYASGGTEGEEPVEEVKAMMELYRELQKVADPEKQIEMMSEIVQMSADYFPQICVTTQPDLFGIVNNNMYNVPPSMIASATYPNPGPTNPEQYFFSGE